MSASQFTIYSSNDTGAPVLSGTVGTLLTVLDACLVNGYGSKLPPSPAWTKPFVNAGNIGCYKQGAGSLASLSVNDNAPGAGGAKEARFTGYDTLTSVSTGTFPVPTAALASASGLPAVAASLIRKSATADAVARDWVVVADSSTLYMFVLTGDVTGGNQSWVSWMYGDIYSLAGSTDPCRICVQGRRVENSGGVVDSLDVFSGYNARVLGMWLAKSAGGGYTATEAGKFGFNVTTGGTLKGNIPTPNSANLSYFICPIWVNEFNTNMGVGPIRGRMRGFYHFCHAVTTVVDGQIIQGVGDMAGKTFMILRQTLTAGVFCIEISATVDTN